MSSEFVETVDKMLRKYPEVFEALEEFDRTHKLRKIYNRKRLNITIDENVLRDFKEYSRKNSINISRFVENQMLKEIQRKRASS